MNNDFDDVQRPGRYEDGDRRNSGGSFSTHQIDQRHGDEFIDNLIAQARNLRLPPPAVSPGFVLARAARKREQRRAFATGFAGAAAIALLMSLVVRNNLSPRVGPEGPGAAVASPRASSLAISGEKAAGTRTEQGCPTPPNATDSVVHHSAPEAPRLHRKDEPLAQTSAKPTRSRSGFEHAALLEKARLAQRRGDCHQLTLLVEKATAGGVPRERLKGLEECTSNTAHRLKGDSPARADTSSPVGAKRSSESGLATDTMLFGGRK